MKKAIFKNIHSFVELKQFIFSTYTKTVNFTNIYSVINSRIK